MLLPPEVGGGVGGAWSGSGEYGTWDVHDHSGPDSGELGGGDFALGEVVIPSFLTTLLDYPTKPASVYTRIIAS